MSLSVSSKPHRRCAWRDASFASSVSEANSEYPCVPAQISALRISARPKPRRRANGSTYQPSTCGTGIESHPSENARRASSRNPSSVDPSSATNTAVSVGTGHPLRNVRASRARSAVPAFGQSLPRIAAHASVSLASIGPTIRVDVFMGKRPEPRFWDALARS